VTIFHPWQSGTDNSPRWDAALERVAVGALSGYMRRVRPGRAAHAPRVRPLCLARGAHPSRRQPGRRDLQGASVPGHGRPGERYLGRCKRGAAGDSARPAAPSGEQAEINASISRGWRGPTKSWNANLGLCLDLDLRANAPLRVRTVAGFSPLVAGGLGHEARAARNPLLRSLPRVPEASLAPPAVHQPLEGRFRPRSYCRGPVWPVIAWLLWWSLGRRAGEEEHAEDPRRASLKALAARGFAEYFETFTPASRSALRINPGPPPSHSTGWRTAPDARDERSQARKSAPGGRGALRVNLGPRWVVSSPTGYPQAGR
jgi:hypothetical protein